MSYLARGLAALSVVPCGTFAVVTFAQPPKTATRVDSLVTSLTATLLRGDTVEIEGRGARSGRAGKVFLVLSDTVYRLVDGQRTPLSPIEADVVRVTAKNVRDFLHRTKFPR